VKVYVVGVDENMDEHGSVVGQSDESGFVVSRSRSTRNWCGAPSPLESFIVIVSPCVAVIVGFEPEGCE
jgi:hypothetical protein